MGSLIFEFSMSRSKEYFCDKYSSVWFAQFKCLSQKYLDEVSAKVPNIGKSIFSMNYKFAPVYIAWYKALEQLEIAPDQIDREIWMMNENLMNAFPKSLLKLSGKIYLDSFQKKAARHVQRQELDKLHPYDWKISFKDIDSNSFEIDISECAYKKLAKDFDVEKMLPGICRIDYMMANLMGNGFIRTKTLGDGDDCCNCKYARVGHCEWSPEKGFEDRK